MICSLIQKYTGRSSKKLDVHVGGTYLTRDGNTVTLMNQLDAFSRASLQGYRYVADNGITYREDGKFWNLSGDHPQDLVSLIG